MTSTAPQTPLTFASKMDSERRVTDFGGKSYYDATRQVLADPNTSYMLRKRIAEDDQRDPHESLTDAEVLDILQSKRFHEQVGVGRKEADDLP